MKRMVAVVVVVLPCLLAGAARADVTIADNDKAVRVDCAKDGNVTLAGNHLSITASGVCASVTLAGNDNSFTGSATKVSVPGNHNTIALAGADDVSVMGNDNTVTIKKALKRKKPNVSNVGTNNQVTP